MHASAGATEYRTGRFAQALAHFSEAHPLRVDLGEPGEAIDSLAGRARARVALGDRDERAPELLRRMHDFVEEVASQLHRETMRRAYLERVPGVRAIQEAWSDAIR